MVCTMWGVIVRTISVVSFADIDRGTGLLAVPGCARVIHEAFLAGTEPTEAASCTDTGDRQ